ncbi:hypothetical protein EDC37_1166 [Pectinatus cerevisiiphilus]|uniref:Uncharacterized protein n=1 Tax=Pectinatus cerevisiiphilus TaxID=86956 RepID=A0A4V2URH4_9FIRM|nr:hypothetical protein EDC37_1166 [Pectinatus cerevisiiphilus]
MIYAMVKSFLDMMYKEFFIGYLNFKIQKGLFYYISLSIL